jgi:peroxiredoxin
VKINSPAPDFTLPTLEGREISLSSLKGKVVILTFWAIWCQVCREEMPVLDSLYKQCRNRGLEVVGVNIDREPATCIQDFVRERGISYPILLDRERKAMKVYRAHFLPTTFVLNRAGVVVDKKVGIHDWMSPQSQGLLEGLLKPK